jgi:hypothetical protein
MPRHTPNKNTAKGIYRPTPTAGSSGTDEEQRVAEFSYQNDALADQIVKAWSETTGGGFYDQLTKGSENARSTAAKRALDDRGVHMAKPIVITEDEFYEGYTMTDNDGVVFVLPNGSRADATGGHSLLEVAKLLMACTPNGI